MGVAQRQTLFNKQTGIQAFQQEVFCFPPYHDAYELGSVVRARYDEFEIRPRFSREQGPNVDLDGGIMASLRSLRTPH